MSTQKSQEELQYNTLSATQAKKAGCKKKPELNLQRCKRLLKPALRLWELKHNLSQP